MSKEKLKSIALLFLILYACFGSREVFSFEGALLVFAFSYLLDFSPQNAKRHEQVTGAFIVSILVNMGVLYLEIPKFEEMLDSSGIYETLPTLTVMAFDVSLALRDFNVFFVLPLAIVSGLVLYFIYHYRGKLESMSKRNYLIFFCSVVLIFAIPIFLLVLAMYLPVWNTIG